MSLNKTLDRLFDEVRREAKRNPDFADRLDAVLRLHESRRDVADEVIEGIAAAAAEPEASPPLKSKKAAPPAPKPVEPAAKTGPASAPSLNPAGLYKREGEEVLRAALAEQKLGALRALVVEHNLDPGGVTSVLTRDELAEHIIDQAKRRAERDDKMFDY